MCQDQNFFSVRLHATLHAIYSITDMRFVSSVDLVNQSRELTHGGHFPKKYSKGPAMRK